MRNYNGSYDEQMRVVCNHSDMDSIKKALRKIAELQRKKYELIDYNFEEGVHEYYLSVKE